MDTAVPPVGGGSRWTGAFTRTTQSFARRFARNIPYRAQPFWKSQLLALACVAAATGVRFGLNPLVHGHIPVIVFYPFVLIASVWGGALSGLSVMVLGAAIADALWLPPSGNVITLTAFSVVSLCMIFITQMFRSLVELHVEDEERATLLAHELKHRSNNLFGVVQAISAQTARNATSVADHQAVFMARLSALARAQQLVSENSEAPPDLRAFLTHIIAPFGADRFHIEGPAVFVPLYLGTSCALLIHELCTNATKYGALSVPDGVVAITWEPVSDRVQLDWRELHGPPVVLPSRAGFGSRLLKTAFPPDHGNAQIHYDPDGVHCTINFARI